MKTNIQKYLLNFHMTYEDRKERQKEGEEEGGRMGKDNIQHVNVETTFTSYIFLMLSSFWELD